MPKLKTVHSRIFREILICKDLRERDPLELGCKKYLMKFILILFNHFITEFYVTKLSFKQF